MSFSTVLSPRRVRRSRNPRFRPSLEYLESRWVPAGAVRFNSEFLSNSLPRGDDNSSAALPIGFTINYFGTHYSSLYINNNGNLSFNSPFTSYQTAAFSGLGKDIIAPFFGDIDTRPSAGGVVYFGSGMVDGRPAFAATWDSVGSYNMQTANTNTFQVVLIDRSDLAPMAFDVELNYDRLTWSHSTSSSSNHARAGFAVNTAPSQSYELPGSGQQDVFLDSNPTGWVHNSLNSTVPGRYAFTFRSGLLTFNQPPQLTTIGPQTIYEGQLLQLDVYAADPDLGQSLSYSLLSAPHGASLDATTGRLLWTPDNTQPPGVYAFHVRVSDNGSPAMNDEEIFFVSVQKLPAFEVSPPATPIIGQGSEFLLDGQLENTGTGPLIVMVDYGDLSGLQPLVVDTDGKFTLNHTYANQDTYTVLVTVSTPDGLLLNQFSFTVNVLPSGAESKTEIFERITVGPGDTASVPLTSLKTGASLELSLKRGPNGTEPSSVFVAFYSSAPIPTSLNGKFFDIQMSNLTTGEDEVTLTFTSSEIGQQFLFGYHDPVDGHFIDLRNNSDLCEIEVDAASSTVTIRFNKLDIFQGTVFSVSLAPTNSVTIGGTVKPPTAQGPSSNGNGDGGTASVSRSVSFNSNTQISLALTASRDSQVSVGAAAQGSQAGSVASNPAGSGGRLRASLSVPATGGSDETASGTGLGEESLSWGIFHTDEELIDLLIQGFDPSLLLGKTAVAPQQSVPLSPVPEEPIEPEALSDFDEFSSGEDPPLPIHDHSPDCLLALLPLLSLLLEPIRRRRLNDRVLHRS